MAWIRAAGSEEGAQEGSRRRAFAAEAMRALTLNAAEIYGVPDRLGSIEKGKIANLVVTRGDAFEDQATVEYVFIDGKAIRAIEGAAAGAGKSEAARSE